MAIDPASALSAYKAASQTGSGNSGGILDQSAQLQGPSFGDILKSATQGTINAQKAGEKASADAVVGKADLTDVVSSVNNAEMTLNLFLSVRDKLIDAYNTITRTQI